MPYRCRKNQASLTADERSRFVAAVLALKASGTYDDYVHMHMEAMDNFWAHGGPAFLPWHRQFLLDFELDLRAIDSSVTLPYWDWMVDNTPTSSLWDVSFMGGDGRPLDGRVMDGPFAYDGGAWTLVMDGPDLRRRFGVSVADLPPPYEFTNAMARTYYDQAPWGHTSGGFRNYLEGFKPSVGSHMHNRVHVWVGGSMAPGSSPNDPVFFLHHCYIDKLWAEWQAANPGAGYLPVSGGPPGHNLSDSMEPWASDGIVVTPASMLDHHALGYAYDTEGLCTPIATFKFADDNPTLKFADDATLKFRDDGATLKFGDDRVTLKPIDDGATIKAADDGPGSFKAIDDVKFPALDVGNLGGTLIENIPSLPLTPSMAPFVLATPHHSMAWAETFPQAFDATVRHLTEQLAMCERLIAEREAAQKAAEGGESSTKVRQELEVLREEHKSLVNELRSLGARRGG